MKGKLFSIKAILKRLLIRSQSGNKRSHFADQGCCEKTHESKMWPEVMMGYESKSLNFPMHCRCQVSPFFISLITMMMMMSGEQM